MKILVIEDEHKIAGAIKKGLEQEGFAVQISYDGMEGFDLASTEEYSVIILDLMLPKMDGLTLCKRLRDEKIHTPILILTAKGELEDKILGLNSGADDYLPKPFAFEELLARIRTLQRRPAEIADNKLFADDLILDMNSLIVSRNNKVISLTKREYNLLEYLMRNKNKILTKDQIINYVWNYESDILPNTVEQYIGYLRNKVDKPFKNSTQLIKTARGFGYILREKGK
ncbi:DNA-binding response regulator [candidate division WWE3 bacterium RBG_16_37_10]|uniref:DNA-binding response regulator n=1 Tax=candidate division WWE3 bacterium RBG_16_37_10 TaxID=1802610 RepID=A0A1F4V1W1_UNCKA|nr:MAG: DNA-binding response regulator [candidate division WWE3 bacterium RBG_16_37_10]